MHTLCLINNFNNTLSVKKLKFMIISHKHKYIFIKTKKTAGSSLEHILMKYSDIGDVCSGNQKEGTPKQNTNLQMHISADKIKKYYPLEWQSYFKFTIDRNPWDYYVSQFYWKMATKTRRAKRGFDKFVKATKNRRINWHLYTINNTVVVDKVFKYETLHEELLNQDLIPYNGELKNVKLKSDIRKNTSYRYMYNEETKEIIRQHCKHMIDYLDYQF